MNRKNLESTIEDLETEIKRIKATIANLRTIGGIKEKADGRSKGGPSIMDAVISHLRAQRRPQTTNQIHQALKMAGVRATESSIQSIMSRRAAKKKDLVHLKRALWGLKS